VLLVCGEGPESAGIAAAASEAGLDKIVHLVGPVRHDSADYDSLFAASDVFVMPNIRVTGDAEGFGLVALEAAVRDLPVVAYGVDGIVDVITDGINGVLIPEGDTASFARAVSGFLQDASVKEDFTKRAKQAVLDKFSWSRIIRLYEERYGCLIKKYC
jgi:glycosyltransferase involved in cell wall biosynthesis